MSHISETYQKRKWIVIVASSVCESRDLLTHVLYFRLSFLVKLEKVTYFLLFFIFHWIFMRYSGEHRNLLMRKTHLRMLINFIWNIIHIRFHYIIKKKNTVVTTMLILTYGFVCGEATKLNTDLCKIKNTAKCMPGSDYEHGKLFLENEKHKYYSRRKIWGFWLQFLLMLNRILEQFKFHPFIG